MRSIWLVLLLSGCTVSADEWAAAERVCAGNEGVSYVWIDGDARCKNGVIVKTLAYIYAKQAKP